MAGNGNTKKANAKRVSQRRMPDYKNVLEVYFCDHLKFTWQTVPLCWTTERKDTFTKYIKE